MGGKANLAPEVKAIVDAWERLPAPVKAGILAMVHAGDDEISKGRNSDLPTRLSPEGCLNKVR